MDKNNDKAHRGRIQVQEGHRDLVPSEIWSQETPLSLKDGLGLIEKLKDKLNSKQQKKYAKSFNKLEDLVKDNSKTGLLAKITKSFYIKNTTKGERVDLEVQKGIAFLNSQEDENIIS